MLHDTGHGNILAAKPLDAAANIAREQAVTPKIPDVAPITKSKKKGGK